MQPAAWQKILNADADTAAAIRGMMKLADVACGDQHLPRKDSDTTNATGPDNIARWVVTLNGWRFANYQPIGIPVRHFVNKANAERYATDPEYRASLIVAKYADR